MDYEAGSALSERKGNEGGKPWPRALRLDRACSRGCPTSTSALVTGGCPGRLERYAGELQQRRGRPREHVTRRASRRCRRRPPASWWPELRCGHRPRWARQPHLSASQCRRPSDRRRHLGLLRVREIDAGTQSRRGSARRRQASRRRFPRSGTLPPSIHGLGRRRSAASRHDRPGTVPRRTTG